MTWPTLFAYIDPASGAIILQLILAGVFGSMLYFRRMLGKVVGLVTGRGKAVEAAAGGAGLEATPEATAVGNELAP